MKLNALEELLREMESRLTHAKSDFELAEETLQTLHQTIEKEFKSDIVSKHKLPDLHKKNEFHNLYKLENGIIVESLLIVHPENLGIQLEIKLREILA